MMAIRDFGPVDSIWLAHSRDYEIRFNASSGGFIKSFMVHLLSSGVVDYAIVTRTGSSDTPLIPETIITNRIEDIVSPRTNSVYAVNNPFAVFREIEADKKYAFVGLPCQIKALWGFQRKGRYANVVFTIGLFCNHTPKIEFTQKILGRLGVDGDNLVQIQYRGLGWPGGFTARVKEDHKEFVKTTNYFIKLTDYWENDLNNGPERCKRCYELAERADVYVGDPWNLGLENKDRLGNSLVVCRNAQATRLVKEAKRAGQIDIRRCSERNLVKSQGYHVAVKLGRKPMPRVITDSPMESDPYTLTYKLCNLPIIRSILRRVFAKRVLVWYWCEERKYVNFGDYITEILLRKFGYKTVGYSSASLLRILPNYKFCLLAIGSELHKHMVDSLDVPEVYVWGEGKGHGDYFDIKSEPYSSKVKLFAVRGPHTVRQLGLDGNIAMGDPGLLLPLFFKVKRDKSQFKITYIPHWTNRDWGEQKKVELSAERFVDVICTRWGFWKKIREIVSSRFVLTNSLHTAIVCQAYGTPWAFCLADGDVINFPDKWRDLFELMGLGNVKPVGNYKEGLEWWLGIESKANKLPLLPLLQSFPLERKLKGIYSGGAE